jgi:hypothetical protein
MSRTELTKPDQKLPRTVSAKAVRKAIKNDFENKSTDEDRRIRQILEENPGARHGISKTKYEALIETKTKIQAENSKQELLLVAQALILCGLPYRALYDESGKPQRTYSRIAKLTNGTMTLEISGLDPKVLLPYGKDRALLTWLQTKAIQQDSPIITWESAKEFFEAFGLTRAGYHYDRFKKTWERLLNTVFVLKQKTNDWQGKMTIEAEHLPLLARYRLPDYETDQERMILDSHLPTIQDRLAENKYPMIIPPNYSVTLADNLYKHLKDSPVPLNLNVMRAFQNEPKAWDIAAFISYRSFLCGLLANEGKDSTAYISFEALCDQIGSFDNNPKQLRTTIRKAIKEIKIIWPECQAELLNGGTMVIKPPLDNAHLVKQKPKTLYDTE